MLDDNFLLYIYFSADEERKLICVLITDFNKKYICVSIITWLSKCKISINKLI